MSETLRKARAAYTRLDWPLARQLFRSEDAEHGLDVEDLHALSEAAWWLGDNDERFEACERAYLAYLDAGRPRRAAIAAIDIAASLFLRGDAGEASGWISRAGRLLEGEEEAAEHGYLLYLLEVEGRLGGIVSSEPTATHGLISSARRVREIGHRHGDFTLEALGSMGEGRILVKTGRASEGLALLDEALLAARSGAMTPIWTGNLFCHVIAAAEELGDLRRARESTDAMTKWLASMPAAVVFSGICRVHRCRIHQLSGDWDEAEREARRVCRELGRIHIAAAARAHDQVGEILRLRGDLDRAEAAFERAHALGRDPQPGMALLRLAQGHIDAATASIRSALLAESHGLRRAELLAARVEVELAAGHLDEARQATDELEGMAERYGSSGLHVVAHHARGAVLLAAGNPEEALPRLREACRRWTEVDAPYDCARVRVLLARTYQLLGDGDSAARELAAARIVFEELGAVFDLQNARAADTPPAPFRTLTPRELEVLTLVASGGSNKAIARTLGISDRTVARHLANLFAKLEVGSRTAAAALAFKHGLVGTPGGGERG